jgi:hypothetical protein
MSDLQATEIVEIVKIVISTKKKGLFHGKILSKKFEKKEINFALNSLSLVPT